MLYPKSHFPQPRWLDHRILQIGRDFVSMSPCGNDTTTQFLEYCTMISILYRLGCLGYFIPKGQVKLHALCLFLYHGANRSNLQL